VASISVEGLRKTTKTIKQVAHIPTEIRTRHFLTTRQTCYHLIQLDLYHIWRFPSNVYISKKAIFHAINQSLNDTSLCRKIYISLICGERTDSKHLPYVHCIHFMQHWIHNRKPCNGIHHPNQVCCIQQHSYSNFLLTASIRATSLTCDI
jgi:hypothetical protein